MATKTLQLHHQKNNFWLDVRTRKALCIPQCSQQAAKIHGFRAIMAETILRGQALYALLHFGTTEPRLSKPN
jgi:hypothetical protein